MAEPPGEPLIVYGASEVANWFLVTKATVSMWLQRYSDYPPPAVAMRTANRTVFGWTADQRGDWQAWITSKGPHAPVSLQTERARLLARLAAIDEELGRGD